MSDHLLETKKLTVGYDKKPFISDIDFSIEPGEIVTMIGPNGAGKSTILKTMSKRLEPIAGTVLLDENDLKSMKNSDMAKKMSILATGSPKPELMTCFEVVCMGRYPYTGSLGILSSEDKEKARMAMALVKIESLAERDFSNLSDGQRQRVMLARAICQEPKILLLDEPTSYLDINYKLELMDILRRLAKQDHIAVLMSLHELELVEKISDRIICIDGNGRVDRIGTPQEIFSHGYIETLFGMKPGILKAFYGRNW